MATHNTQTKGQTMVNSAYIASDKLKDIKRGERPKDKPAKPSKPSKPSASVLTLDVLELVKQGKVREANAIINASKVSK